MVAFDVPVISWYAVEARRNHRNGSITPKIRSPLPSHVAHRGAVALLKESQAKRRVPRTTIGIHTIRNLHRVSNNQLTAAAPRPIRGRPLMPTKPKKIDSPLGTGLKAEPDSRGRIPEIDYLLHDQADSAARNTANGYSNEGTEVPGGPGGPGRKCVEAVGPRSRRRSGLSTHMPRCN